MNENCKCRICRLGLETEAWETFQVNKSIQDVADYFLEKEGFDMPLIAISNHFKKTAGIVLESSAPLVYSNDRDIDLNDLNVDEFDFEMNDPESLMTFMQKLHLRLYLNQAKIVAREQQDYIAGISDEPAGLSINRLSALQRLLENFTGISIIARQDKAIQTVQMMGYNIISPGATEKIQARLEAGDDV